MLRELRIENLLLIERAELRLEVGFNVITGETGAGKTVLAHSLDLLMGGKARPQIVRPGAEEAYVEGVFALPPDLFADEELAELAERMPEDSEDIVLGRRIGVSGRTICGRARPPISRSSECASTVLPAPVSPVITLNPSSRRSSARSISSRFSILSSRSITRGI